MFQLLIVFLLTQVTKEVNSSLDPDLSQHCLRAHNDYRGRHNAPKLTWSGELAEQAQNWANHLAAIDQMERDPNTKDGENIFYMYGGDPSEACDRAVENWYSEFKNYDFKDPHESPSTDHFSQIVWKNTKEIGVGTAQSKSGNFFLVARYNPRGNNGGVFQDNVEGASDVPIKVNSSKSTPPSTKDTSTEVAKETPTKPTTPTTPTSSSESDAKVTKPSSTSSSAGSSLAIPEPAYEDEISSKNVSQKDEKQVSKRPDAEIKLGKLESDKSSSASPGDSLLMTPPKYGKDYRVEIRFTEIEFADKMTYPSSKEFTNMKLAITSPIMQMYEDRDEFLEVQLLALRNGSVIATLGLIFSKPGHNYLDKLTIVVAEGRLGEMVISRDYVSADALPDGYLKLTLPHQPTLYGQCPQPCSNPTHCYQTGCNVECCSFHPITSPTQQPAAAVCPASCPSTCYPQCTNECCNDKIVAPQVVHVTSTASPPIDYSQCQAACPVTCIPECTPECCFAPSTKQCSNNCAEVCSTECPQECCAKKSGIHSLHFGHPTLSNYHQLPPLNHGRATSFMYGPKYGSLSNPIRHVPKVRRPKLNQRQQYTSNVPASYWQRYLKIAASYGYGSKDGAMRNSMSPKPQKMLYTHPTKAQTQQKKVPSHNRQPTKNLQTRKQRVQSSYGTQPGAGIRIIKDLKSKGAPLNIRYAYRYGDRLLVPIDLPKSMAIKELKGKKFISVPAFKRSEVANNLQRRRNL